MNNKQDNENKTRTRYFIQIKDGCLWIDHEETDKSCYKKAVEFFRGIKPGIEFRVVMRETYETNIDS